MDQDPDRADGAAKALRERSSVRRGGPTERRRTTAGPGLEVLPAVVLARDLLGSELEQLVATGELVRVRRGAYVVAPDEEHGPGKAARRLSLARIRAVGRQIGNGYCFSHESAALLWGLDVLRPGPVHVWQRSRPGRRRTDCLVRHHGDLPADHRTVVRGLSVTTVERTVLDCARTLPTDRALVIADSALRAGADEHVLGQMVTALVGQRGAARARRVLELADGRAESVGETLTRFAVHNVAGVGPQPQVPVDTHRGRFYLDLGWPEQRVGIEFDGLVKYSGRYGSATQVVFEEKRRQDAIEEEGWRLLRVTWADLRDPVALSDRVARALRRSPRP